MSPGYLRGWGHLKKYHFLSQHKIDFGRKRQPLLRVCTQLGTPRALRVPGTCSDPADLGRCESPLSHLPAMGPGGYFNITESHFIQMEMGGTSPISQSCCGD